MVKKRKAAAVPEAEEEPQKTIADHSSSEDPEEEEPEEESENESEEGEEEEESEEEEEEDEDEEEEEEEEEEDEESKRETLKKLLEPFGKDQIIEFLKQAALKNPKIIERLTQSAESDPVHRKIFIHGLGWDATSEQVLSVFKKYGEIEECKVVTDKITGRSKGYGFVLFKYRNGARKALKHSQKKVGNRMTSCQLASGSVPNNIQLSWVPPSDRKIYVMNVGPQTNPDKLRSFFVQFGEIEEGPVGQDPVTGKFRGYALFVYKTQDGFKKALEQPLKVFEGTQLQCRRAEGNRGNKNQPGGGAASVQQTDTGAVNYGMGTNPAAIMVGQNPGMGMANPMMASAMGQTVLPPTAAAATGFPHSIRANPALGLGFGGNYGINSISPSMIGSYSSQAVLQGSYGPQIPALQGGYGSTSQAAGMQGLGAYQSAHLGQSSAGAVAAAPTTRPQSGFGTSGATFPNYFGR